MKQILIITSRPDDFAGLAAGLEKHESLSVLWADSKEKALAAVAGKTVDLAVIDESMGEVPGLQIAKDILMKNALVNLAVVSRLAPAIFHDEAEGLGIMAQLPIKPDAGDAKRLMETLKSITG